MMHIIKTFFERLMLGVFSGSRKPPSFRHTEPADPGWRSTQAQRTEYNNKKRKYDEGKKEHDKTIEAFDGCLFDETDQKIVDERVKNLVGSPNWIKASLVNTQQHVAQHYNTRNPRNFDCMNNYPRIFLSYDNFH